jgi:TM2 domain-containing membrane protein YozV
LLGILLGGLGIHRFYLGYVGIGIVQIVVTIVTFGFGAIWGFVEGIMILVGAEMFRRDAKGIPLKE